MNPDNVNSSSTSQATPPTNSAKTKSPRKLANLAWAAVGLVVVLIIIGLVTGFFYAGFKSHRASVVVEPNICDTKVAGEFNKAYNVLTSHQAQTAAIGHLAKSIAGNTGYEKDATCAFIEFYYYQQIYDTKNTDHYFNVVQKLSQEGQYPNPNLMGIMSISQMKVITEGR